MTKTEARGLMMKYLIPQIQQYGFKERKGGSEFQIIRKTKGGEDIINGGFTDYNPVQQIIYSFYKRDKHILAILKSLEEKGITLSPPVSKHTGTIGFSYKTINHLDNYSYLPEMETEADVEKCVGMMLEFIEGTALPLLDKFEDLREIDKVINGNEPWTTDWKKPYSFGTYFNFIRLIVAKLAGNVNYNYLIDFTYNSIEWHSKEDGSPFTYDRSDLTKPLPALIKLLEDVKSLY